MFARRALAVFDLGGRRVRQLIEAHHVPAGRHLAVWDGRSSSSSQVAADIHFVRLETDGASAAGRIVRLR